MADRSYTETLVLLDRKGLKYSTVFDIGSADGHFFVEHYAYGLFRGGAKPVNIDPNPVYEPTLRAIQEGLGGHYLLAATSDAAGEVVLTDSQHPYWSSLRPPDDSYWKRINKLSTESMTVPARRLDDIAEELQLQGPYLIKLDVQGAELATLRGAPKVLAETSVVICEADVEDFQAINSELVSAGFILFDITVLNYLADQSLGWFYPVYIHSRFKDLLETQIWRQESNQLAIQNQAERRRKVLLRVSDLLAKLKSGAIK